MQLLRLLSIRARRTPPGVRDAQPWRCTYIGAFGRCTRMRTGSWSVCWRHLPRQPARPA